MTYKAEALKLPYGWTSFITTWKDGEKIASVCTEVLTATKEEALRVAQTNVDLLEFWKGSISGRGPRNTIVVKTTSG